MAMAMAVAMAMAMAMAMALALALAMTDYGPLWPAKKVHPTRGQFFLLFLKPFHDGTLGATPRADNGNTLNNMGLSTTSYGSKML